MVTACARDLIRLILQEIRSLHLPKRSPEIHALSKALAKALKDSRHASSWPGDRLPVSLELSEKVEELTRRLKRETEAFAHG